MEEENSSFLDKNTLFAVGLSILVFIGWQAYLDKKFPERGKKETTQVVSQTQDLEVPSQKDNNVSDSLADQPTEMKSAAAVEPSESRVEPEQVLEISLNNLDFKLSSQGMGLSRVELNKYSDRDNSKIKFLNPQGVEGNFATLYKGQLVPFNIEEKAPNHFVGTARLPTQTILKEMIFDDATYTVNVSIKTLSGNVDKSGEISTFMANNVLKVESSSFMAPSLDGTEFFSINDGDEERERIDIDSNFDQTFAKASLTSIATQYFAIALKDNSPTIPKNKLTYNPQQKVAHAWVIYPEATNGQATDIQFIGYMGPKKYDILNQLDGDFVRLINYGMFSALSKPMLKLLKWLHSVFSNWGVAIIILTIVIRLLLLPINISSLKSMRKMQTIQPQLKAIKEKYKEDPQRMNQETMALMKKEGANPISGCLPMFLQLPVFLALYSVIGQSVELYKSPFIFWIQDLSYKDPFFVLPIAVGALYFVQMNITPQPADPTQAKVMKIIPLVFCFFMITFPSGLTLYFFVNTIFGIGQQYFFQREKRKAAA